MKTKIYIFLCLFLSLGIYSNKTAAQYSFISTNLEYSACDSLDYRLGINTYLSSTSYDSLTVRSYFGDGSSSTVTCLSGTPRAYVGHIYAVAGVYTVKSVLMYNGVAEDSIVFMDTVNLCTTMHVVSYVDHNHDCVFDAGDSYLYSPYTIQVDSNGVSVDTITSTSFYYAGGGAGTIYTFRILTLPTGYVLSCPADSVIHDTVSSTMPSSWYASFGFTCNTATFDLHVWGYFSAGLTGACSHAYAYEYGCDTVPGTSLTINYSQKYAYASNSLGLTPSSSGTGVVTFSLGTLAPGSSVNMVVYYTTVGTPTLGDTTNTTWTIDPITGDINPANNIHSEVDTIKSSFDPNEKSVSPQGYINSGTQLEYTIGFENTGNDTAFNIHVQDTLSANLDITTFKLISATAPVTTEITTIAGGQHVVKFDFANIDLLDASHPGSNTGMVMFYINAKNGLANGITINNRAGIYFDYNPVVMTNTTTNIIGFPTSATMLTNANGISIYPNPANDVLNIHINNGSFNEFTIYNNIGEALIHEQLNTAQLTVNTTALPAGMYFVELRGDKGRVMRKFVKE